MVQSLVCHHNMIFLLRTPGVDISQYETCMALNISFLRQSPATVQHVLIKVQALQNEIRNPRLQQSLSDRHLKIAVPCTYTDKPAGLLIEFAAGTIHV